MPSQVVAGVVAFAVAVAVAVLILAGCADGGTRTGIAPLDGTALATTEAGGGAGERPEVSRETLDYFLEIAFGSEDGRGRTGLVKWVTSPGIEVVGVANEEQRGELQRVIAELNVLIAGQGVALRDVPSGGDIRVVFGRFEDFTSILEPEQRALVAAHADVLGMFIQRVRYAPEHGATVLAHVDVFVRADGSMEPQRQRHVLREEVTQALGLGQDSDRYEDSIFRDSPSLVTGFSSIDRAIIALLYNPALKSGFTSEDVLGAVRVR